MRPDKFYVRVSGSLTTSASITINKNVTILGDTGSELIYDANAANINNPALLIQFDNSNDPSDPHDTHNAEIVICNFRILEISGSDNIRILGVNPVVKFTHVSIDDGDNNSMANGHGISTSDPNDSSVVAMNPNIVLTDVTIRGKINGIQTTGGQLTVVQSSIFSNTGDAIFITGTVGINNKFTINKSSIYKNKTDICTSNVDSRNLNIYDNSPTTLKPQIDNCN